MRCGTNKIFAVEKATENYNHIKKSLITRVFLCDYYYVELPAAAKKSLILKTMLPVIFILLFCFLS